MKKIQAKDPFSGPFVWYFMRLCDLAYLDLYEWLSVASFLEIVRFSLVFDNVDSLVSTSLLESSCD